MRLSLLLFLALGVSIFFLNESYKDNGKLLQDIRALEEANENVQKLPPLISNLCEETKTVDKIITKTVYKIKEVPVYEETSTFDLSAELNSLLSETFDSLHLQRAPTGTPH